MDERKFLCDPMANFAIAQERQREHEQEQRRRPLDAWREDMAGRDQHPATCGDLLRMVNALLIRLDMGK